MVYWDDLGFETAFTVDDELEYPSDGDWGMPEVLVPSTMTSLTGAPLAIVRPTDRQPWVLTSSVPDWFALYGGPDPRVVYLMAQYDQFVAIDVFDPTRQLRLHSYPVRVSRSRDPDLLLVAGWQDMIAIGQDGVAWKSEWLVLDDLKIRRADNGRIVCQGGDETGRPDAIQLVLDARTGEVIEGRPYYERGRCIELPRNA